MIEHLKHYPSMKASDVEWLAEVPAHWEIAMVKQKYAIQLGKMLQTKPNNHDDVEIPYLKAQHVQWFHVRTANASKMWASQEDMDQFGVRLGDLLVCEGGEGGRCGILKQKLNGYIIQNALHRVRPREHCRNDYLQYVMSSVAATGWFDASNDKATIAHFTREKFGALRVPIPSLPEQTTIVRFLDHADQRIRRYVRAKQTLIALLEEQKQAIIHQAVTGQIDIRTGQPYPAYKPSGMQWLKKIPAHWNGISLRAATHSIQTGPFGSQLHVSDYVSEGIPVINPSHMRNGGLVPDSSISITQQKADELSRHKLRPHDIVMARRGEVGRCALGTDAETDWLCGTGSLRIRPRFQTFVPEYLLLVLGAPETRDALSLSSIGATMNNLNAGIVSKLMLPLPSLPEQIAIIRYFDKATAHIDTVIGRAHRQIDLLHEYRTRLVADVVTGKFDVREAAAALPEVNPLAAEDDLDSTFDTGASPDLDEIDSTLEETEV